VSEDPPLTHDRAFELLPWLVNGTLEEVERAAVDAHARTCIVCRRELKQQQRLSAALRANASTNVSIDAGLERLDATLDAGAGGSSWRMRAGKATPFAVAAAAGLAVLAVLLWFTPLPDMEPSPYSTLAAVPPAEAPLLDVVFAEDATAAEMRQLLDEIGGDIVAGPSDLGRYRIRISDAGSGARPLGEVLRALRSDPRVRFAGRSFTEIDP
jgi:hypothetical protein